MANPLTTLARILLPPREEFQQRTLELAASFDEQINILTRQRAGRPWRVSSIQDALGVPAIWGAVSLIADTVGSLSLEAFRQGALLTPEDRPRLIIRPNPFTTSRDFFRDSAFYLASRGECWWWIAARDGDGLPLSLYPVPPWEITVEVNPKNRLRPIIKWADRIMPNDDMRQITYMPGGLRGIGPLQACGAAISAAVESQEWAANWFAGNIPSLIGETEQMMSESEMTALKQQWLEEDNANLPRFVDQGLKLHLLDVNPASAQLTDSRQYSVGDGARMFNMPGTLIEFQMSGQSLHYQNDQSIWTDFQRRCLSPHYLEPIEQQMSDFLTRATVARFNVKQLLRASPKERMEVHTLAITAGIYDAATAAAEEGYAPGNVDYAPVPLALPAAIPLQLPTQQRSLSDLRCVKCGRLAGRVSGNAEIKCQRCGELVVA
jgi:HK97 family phage portal protein